MGHVGQGSTVWWVTCAMGHERWPISISELMNTRDWWFDPLFTDDGGDLSEYSVQHTSLPRRPRCEDSRRFTDHCSYLPGKRWHFSALVRRSILLHCHLRSACCRASRHDLPSLRHLIFALISLVDLLHFWLCRVWSLLQLHCQTCGLWINCRWCTECFTLLVGFVSFCLCLDFCSSNIRYHDSSSASSLSVFRQTRNMSSISLFKALVFWLCEGWSLPWFLLLGIHIVSPNKLLPVRQESWCCLVLFSACNFYLLNLRSPDLYPVKFGTLVNYCQCLILVVCWFLLTICLDLHHRLIFALSSLSSMQVDD